MGHFDVRVSPTDRLREITVMKRGPLTPGMSPHQMGVLLATCALHAIGIYYVATQAVTGRGSLWNTLEVSFIPITKQEPPPPPIIPVLLTDAFAEHLLIYLCSIKTLSAEGASGCVAQSRAAVMLSMFPASFGALRSIAT